MSRLYKIGSRLNIDFRDSVTNFELDRSVSDGAGSASESGGKGW